jgi:hypothetical protein
MLSRGSQADTIVTPGANAMLFDVRDKAYGTAYRE